MAAVPLGIVLAAVAKPFLIPFLLWMIVFRRRGAASPGDRHGREATRVAVAVMGPSVISRLSRDPAGATGLDLSYSLGLSGDRAGVARAGVDRGRWRLRVLLVASRDESSLLVWSLLIGLWRRRT